MAKSSIHIEAGGGGYFAHNSREAPTVNSIFSDEQNFCSCSKEEAFKTYRSELEKRTEAYKENHNRTKLHAKTITHLSAIVNFNKDHTPEDMKRVCDLLERKFDTKVIQFSMHRDEGHIKEDGTPDKNYHAHIEFMGLDSKGESVRRKLDRPALRELQSDVSKLLKMERGHDYAKEGLSRPKRLDTYPFKHHKQELEKAVKEAVLATQKDLNAEMAVLRSQLKEQGATRAEYAQLEQINRELKEQIKAKELSNDDLKKSLETVRSLRSSDQTKIYELSQTVDELKTDILKISTKNLEEPINATLIVQLQDENKLLKILNQGLETDLKEAKSATVSAPSVDVEPIREILRTATINDQSPSNDEIIKRRKEIEDLKAYNGKRIIEASKETTALGSITGAKKLDEALLQRNIDKILTLHFKAHESGDKLIDKFHRAKDAIIDGTKSLIKRAETTLEAFFSKKAGDLSSTPKKELVEQLQRTIRSREEILKDAKALSQDFYDKLKDQGKEKEPEPTKSRGIDFGGR